MHLKVPCGWIQHFQVDQFGESATTRLTDAGSRGVYKRKNKSLRSLCVPVVAGISGQAKKNLSAVGYNAKEF